MNKIIKLLFAIIFLLFASFLISCKGEKKPGPGEQDTDPEVWPSEPYIELGENLTEILVGEKVDLLFTSSADARLGATLEIKSSDEETLKIENKSMIGVKEGNATVTIQYTKDNEALVSKELNVQVIEEKIEIIMSEPRFLVHNNELNLNEVFKSTYLPLTFTIGTLTGNGKIEGNKLIPVLEGMETVVCHASRNNLEFSESIDILILADESNMIDLVWTTKMDLGSEFELYAYSLLPGDEIGIDSSDTSVIKVEGKKLIAMGIGEATISVFSALTNITKEFTVEVSYDWPTDEVDLEGVYLGLVNYGSVTSSQMASFQYRFSINGTTSTYSMQKVGAWEYQNLLEEGNIYHLTVSNNTITKLVKCDDQETFAQVKKSSLVEGKIEAITPFDITIDGKTYKFLETTGLYEITKTAGGSRITKKSQLKVNDNVIVSLTKNGFAQNVYKSKETPSYTPPVTAVPGERTLTNFFRTALSAVGHALYVYGGAWNYEDDGSSNQARTIGVADSWVEFFYEQDAYYTYKNSSDYSSSYYPHNSFNEYYYAGVDCSGFVGWVMYNVMNTENGQPGYVQGSTKMAKTFASLGLGTYTRNFSQPSSTSHDFKVGDIMSTDGHVWICLGECSDHSLVIIHSTPSESIYGYSGGGAQIGAIGSNENCEAYKLADAYNKKYYPDWSSRYHTSLKSYSAYTKITNANAGKFTWNLDTTGVLDPDGLATKSPAEIFKIVFNED